MATNGTKVPALKNVPATTDRELKATLESMKEAQEIRLGRRGDPRDRAITLRELIESGLAKQLRENPFDPNAGAGAIDFTANTPLGDLTVPPAPTALEASGAFTAIILNWNGMSASAPYGNHAYTEIWRSRDNNLAGATLRATTTAFIYTDEVGYGETYYYWVRYVSTSNVPGPYNNTNGVEASTVENIAEVMQELSEELQDLPGYSALTDLISGSAGTAATVIRSISSPTTRDNGDALVGNDIWIDTDDNNQAYFRNAANSAWIAARDSNLISLYNSLSSTVTTNTSNISTAQSDIVTLTSDTTANASAITSLTSTVNSNTSAISTNTSAIATEQTARANADSALATDITNLTSTVNSNTSAISSEATTRANADSALSTSISNLTSTVNGNTSSITSLSTTTANINGDLNAMYVLQAATETNGSVSVAGMVIGSNADSGSGAQSYVQFQADKFAIWNGSSEIAPFIVSGGTVFIKNAMIQDAAITNVKILDGTIQTAKIGDAQITNAKIGDAQITNAKIVDATIQTAKIQDAAITNAKINDLSADKINAGFISADRIQANTITADKINVTDLALEFIAATVSGTTIGYWNNNTMRLKKVADLGTAPGIYHIFCRVFGGSGQVKTLSIVAGDGTYGTGSSFELRDDFAYGVNQLFALNLPIADQGYAQYNSGQAQTWSGVDRFDSTYKMVQKDFIVRKVSSTSRTLSLYILAQGDGSFRYLSNVQYGVYKFSEI
jgi:hypothetical protein